MRFLAVVFVSLPFSAQILSETAVSDIAYTHNNDRPVAAGSDGRNFQVAISPDTMLTGSPRVAWNGTEFLVAWTELFPIMTVPESPPAWRGNIRAERVSASVTVLDPEPLRVATGDAEDDQLPLTASDGRGFMVSWSRGGSVHARGIAADATLGTAIELDAGTASSLAWDGARYALAYSTPAGDTLIRRIGSDSVQTIETGADATFGASLLPLGKGLLVAAYERVASEPAYGSVPRVFLKTAAAGTRTRVIR